MKEMPFLSPFYCKTEHARHIATPVKHFLVQMFGSKIIKRDCRLPWPLRSPDLTSADIWLWGYLRTWIYKSTHLIYRKVSAEWYQCPCKSATLFHCWICNWPAMCYPLWLWLLGKYWVVINNMNTFCLLFSCVSFDVDTSAPPVGCLLIFFCIIDTNTANLFLFRLF